MNRPIKGSFKTFREYIKITGHNDKELDPKQFTRIKSNDRVLYLTFDTCPTDEVDYQIINWLIDNKIPSTIFLNIKWMMKNEDKDLSFLSNDLFEIGGHGFDHRRPTTQNIGEQRRDINRCIKTIKEKTGCSEFHLSAKKLTKSASTFHKENLFMNGSRDIIEDAIFVSYPESIKAIKKQML
jgi:peptidoglycan/xylan/chitin deacetylase (PgdA/CDA1 family)